MNINDFINQFNLQGKVSLLSQRQYLVYQLLQGQEIVYIGISDTKHVYSRIKSHANDKEFDNVSFFNVGVDRLACEQIEKGLISLIRPNYNKKDSFVNLSAIKEALKLLENLDQPSNQHQTISEEEYYYFRKKKSIGEAFMFLSSLLVICCICALVYVGINFNSLLLFLMSIFAGISIMQKGLKYRVPYDEMMASLKSGNIKISK